MKLKIALLSVVFALPVLAEAQNCDALKRGLMSFFRGFSSPTYLTASELTVKNVDTNQSFIIDNGLKYRVLGREDGELFIKVRPWVVLNGNKIEYSNETNNDNITNQLYSVDESEMEIHQNIWKLGLSWSTLILPVKYRPETELNGTKYTRSFSTDISIGPFYGYKFKLGEYFDQFLKVDAFAGPTLVSFPVTVKPNNGDIDQSNITNENVIGFAFGGGVVYQLDNLQIGVISGRDYIGGERSESWQYDGKRWVSVAIGYSFVK